jgi:hypothetical protein
MVKKKQVTLHRTILGRKGRGFFNKKRFLDACQKEADIIVTAVLFGYILWRTTLKQAVTIAPPSDKEDGKIVDKLNALMSSADTTTDEEEQEAQIVGYIHGACLCLLARELLPNLLELAVCE